jgi:hypothetical protein
MGPRQKWQWNMEMFGTHKHGNDRVVAQLSTLCE